MSIHREHDARHILLLHEQISGQMTIEQKQVSQVMALLLDEHQNLGSL